MDQWAVTLAPAEGAGYNEPTLGLYAAAVVNGQELPEVLDIGVFFGALTGAGVRPLFTCTCGVFGCGGYYIGGARTAEAWIWRNRYPPGRRTEPGAHHGGGRAARRLTAGARGGEGPPRHAPWAAAGQARRPAHGGVDGHRPAR